MKNAKNLNITIHHYFEIPVVNLCQSRLVFGFKGWIIKSNALTFYFGAQGIASN